MSRAENFLESTGIDFEKYKNKDSVKKVEQLVKEGLSSEEIYDQLKKDGWDEDKILAALLVLVATK
jgi:hypothetical protein